MMLITKLGAVNIHCGGCNELYLKDIEVLDYLDNKKSLDTYLCPKCKPQTSRREKTVEELVCELLEIEPKNFWQATQGLEGHTLRLRGETLNHKKPFPRCEGELLRVGRHLFEVTYDGEYLTADQLTFDPTEEELVEYLKPSNWSFHYLHEIHRRKRK